METKWTKGPWTASPGFNGQSDDERAAILAMHPHYCEIVGGGYPKPEGFSVSGHCGQANAHLIAAAPELYEALRDMCAVGGLDDGTDVIAKANAALAKARGEQQ